MSYGGRKGSSSGVRIRTQGLTLLSELGIMVSVIQEPNLEPDARTVMGLLTPVNFPQPGGQRRERGKDCIQIHRCFNRDTVTNKTQRNIYFVPGSSSYTAHLKHGVKGRV